MEGDGCTATSIEDRVERDRAMSPKVVKLTETRDFRVSTSSNPLFFGSINNAFQDN